LRRLGGVDLSHDGLGLLAISRGKLGVVLLVQLSDLVLEGQVFQRAKRGALPLRGAVRRLHSSQCEPVEAVREGSLSS
jgi:hypothetical protein